MYTHLGPSPRLLLAVAASLLFLWMDPTDGSWFGDGDTSGSANVAYTTQTAYVFIPDDDSCEEPSGARHVANQIDAGSVVAVMPLNAGTRVDGECRYRIEYRPAESGALVFEVDGGDPVMLEDWHSAGVSVMSDANAVAIHTNTSGGGYAYR